MVAEVIPQPVQLVERHVTGQLVIRLALQTCRHQRHLSGALEFLIADLPGSGFLHQLENEIDHGMDFVGLRRRVDTEVPGLQPCPVQGMHHIDQLLATQGLVEPATGDIEARDKPIEDVQGIAVFQVRQGRARKTDVDGCDVFLRLLDLATP